jgi:hypothetical protein
MVCEDRSWTGLNREDRTWTRLKKTTGAELDWAMILTKSKCMVLELLNLRSLLLHPQFIFFLTKSVHHSVGNIHLLQSDLFKKEIGAQVTA